MAPSLCAGGNIGADGAVYLEPEEWLVTGSYRFFKAFRDFKGSKNIPFPSPPGIYAKNYINTWHASVTYALTKRLSLTLGLPFGYGTRSTYLEHDGVTRHTMRNGGVGDLRLMSYFWLLDPDKYPEQNFQLGL